MTRDSSSVLVTGASGFFGVNIVRCLAERGRMVIATTRDAGGLGPLVEDYLKGVEDYVDWVELDVRDFESFLRIADCYELDGLIHAAFTTPGTMEVERSRPREILTSNLLGTVNALELARRAGVRRLVFVSTSGLYGSTPESDESVPEESPQPYLRMSGFYHITKITGEKLAERYSRLFPMTTVSMRVPVIYGPMERPTSSRSNMGPIYRFLELVLTEKRRKIRVKGANYERDWTYVMDAAGGLVAGLDVPEPKYPVYNISYGVNHSVEEVLEVILDVPGVDFEWEEVEEIKDADIIFPEDRRRGPLKIEKAKKDLGFNPRIDLKQGIREYCEWWMEVTRKGFWLPSSIEYQ